MGVVEKLGLFGGVLTGGCPLLPTAHHSSFKLAVYPSREGTLDPCVAHRELLVQQG